MFELLKTIFSPGKQELRYTVDVGVLANTDRPVCRNEHPVTVEYAMRQIIAGSQQVARSALSEYDACIEYCFTLRNVQQVPGFRPNTAYLAQEVVCPEALADMFGIPARQLDVMIDERGTIVFRQPTQVVVSIQRINPDKEPQYVL